ncbi:MAG TPA: ABC transporter permease, partial [Chitinophagaceae bacterium]|nr:ABC transporter permease [Chitinophagaceae bacterium]
MLRNDIKIAWRNIKKNRVSSLINISGLAIGMASAIFIFLYVQDELRYDKFFTDIDKIYQVNVEGKMGGEEFLTGNTPPPVGAALKTAFPEVETYTRVYRPGDVVVRHEKETKADYYFTETRVFGVDSNFLEVFDYAMLEGDRQTCLHDPNSVVISENISKKYFDNTDAIGKILLFGNDKKPFKVSGILKNIPPQSSFQFDILRPIASYRAVKQFTWSWVWLQVNTYVKLSPEFVNNESNLKALEAKFPPMIRQQAASAFERIGMPLDDLKKQGGKWELHLKPFSRVHLHTSTDNARYNNLGDIKYVRIFSLIAFFIIVLACVNFMNLSTAQSATRAKEVGIRKVLGSLKFQLMKQFFGETLLFVALSALIAMLLVILFLNPFNALSGKEFSFDLLLGGRFWIYFAGVILFTSLLAGSYPAFYLTSFKPIGVIKGKLSRSGLGSLFIRNGMVIFQFTISTALIICTIIVFQQLLFTRNADMGLNKENTLIIANTERLGTSEKSFKEEISVLPEIAGSSITSSVPTMNWFGDRYEPEANGEMQVAKDINLASFIIDEEFIPIMEVKLIKGRNFSKEFNDSASV